MNKNQNKKSMKKNLFKLSALMLGLSFGLTGVANASSLTEVNTPKTNKEIHVDTIKATKAIIDQQTREVKPKEVDVLENEATLSQLIKSVQSIKDTNVRKEIIETLINELEKDDYVVELVVNDIAQEDSDMKGNVEETAEVKTVEESDDKVINVKSEIGKEKSLEEKQKLWNEIKKLDEQNPERVKKNFSDTHVNDIFIKEVRPGFYSYDEFVKHRESIDPELRLYDFFKGFVVNTPSGRIVSDYEKYETQDLETVRKEDPYFKEKFELYRLFSDLTSFSLKTEPAKFEDTTFVFMDVNENKMENLWFLKELQDAIADTRYNVIVVPLSFRTNESLETNFEILKIFSMFKAETVFKLPPNILDQVKVIKTREDVARRFVDGLETNNVIYYKDMNLANPVTLLKYRGKDGDFNFIYNYEILSKEEIPLFLSGKTKNDDKK